MDQNLEKQASLLILDDEEFSLHALERLFRGKYHLLLFTDPQKALAALDHNEKPELILTDFRMPQMNGLDFLRDASQKSPNSIRCMLTGQIDSVDLAEAINSSIIHRLFLKPWDNSVLQMQLHEALLQQKLLKERNILAQLAITDPVTQIHNHRFFQDALLKEIERAKRHQRNLCLLMIDIDHFKKFNDHFGHPSGDQALFEVASFLKSSIRNIDHIARYGGEEFAIILPDTNLKSGAEVAERIRSQFESHFKNGPKSTKSAPLTVSIGISEFPIHGDTAAKIVEMADSALYRAKNTGRNQTQVATS